MKNQRLKMGIAKDQKRAKKVLKLCFVGLGNPGSKYNNTRHNIGKDWLLKLCESESVKLLNKTKFEADLAYSESEEILYVVPNNYVNNSGRTISKLVKNLNLSKRSYFANFLDAQDARGRRELRVVKISALNDPWRYQKRQNFPSKESLTAS